MGGNSRLQVGTATPWSLHRLTALGWHEALASQYPCLPVLLSTVGGATSPQGQTEQRRRMEPVSVFR